MRAATPIPLHLRSSQIASSTSSNLGCLVRPSKLTKVLSIRRCITTASKEWEAIALRKDSKVALATSDNSERGAPLERPGQLEQKMFKSIPERRRSPTYCETLNRVAGAFAPGVNAHTLIS